MQLSLQTQAFAELGCVQVCVGSLSNDLQMARAGRVSAGWLDGASLNTCGQWHRIVILHDQSLRRENPSLPSLPFDV